MQMRRGESSPTVPDTSNVNMVVIAMTSEKKVIIIKVRILLEPWYKAHIRICIMTDSISSDSEF